MNKKALFCLIAAFGICGSLSGESKIPGVPIPDDGEMNTSQGYPNWSGDCFWAFDGDTVTFPNNLNSNTLRFDAGVPRSVSKVRFLPWNNSAANGAYNNMTVFASVDGESWDKIIDNGGTAQDINTWFEYAPTEGDSFGKYRYFEFRNCKLGWGREVEIYSNDLMIETYCPRIWTETDKRVLAAADSQDGVYFSGRLINAPAGGTGIVVYIAAKDYGFDEQAWAKKGIAYEVATVGADGAWSTNIKLDRGLWYSRAFVKVGEISSASQRTESFVVDSGVYYPDGYSSYGSIGAYKMYDGSTDTCGDSANKGQFPLVLDVRNMQDANGNAIWPASIKMWTAKSAQAMYLAWTWARGTIIDASWDDITLSKETMNDMVKNRTVYTCSLPEMNWVRITDASGFVEKQGAVYEMTLPRSFKTNPPKYIRVRGAPLNYVAELEIRTLPSVDGSVIIIK